MGTVDATARWQTHYAQILKEHGFVPGLSNPSLFVHVERDIRLLVHGDDFMVEKPTHEEKWFDSVLFSKRLVLTSISAELEADTRHVAMVLRDLGLEKTTPVVTPVAKRPKSAELLLLARGKPVNAEDTTLCRSVTMRVNFLSLDRPDLSFAAGSLA